jgi:PPOX class probable F420-dependent enzyme
MRQRIADARVARLATVRPDGRPHIVPCCFALDTDTATIYTAVDDVKTKSTAHLQRLDNIAANPSASLLVDQYDDDWSQLWWVRVDGQAGETGDLRGLELLAAKYHQYRDRPPPGPLIAVRIERWRAWP